MIRCDKCDAKNADHLWMSGYLPEITNIVSFDFCKTCRDEFILKIGEFKKEMCSWVLREKGK